MNRFKSVFTNKSCFITGMIHVEALPGTPKYAGNFQNIIDKARYEAEIYRKHKLDAVLIENMHDIPYIQNNQIGPEILTSMTRVATEIRQILPINIKIGIQILACGNKQAIAIAKSTNLQFIRSEGFIFSHIADEGFCNADAGELLRYRKKIDANNILIFTDIKKKHSSHTITNDITILETAHAAEFFLSDGVILTGKSTGHKTDVNDLNEIYNKIKIPILIGSGVTTENLKDYYNKSNIIIVGSFFKLNGDWNNDLCENRIKEFMEIAMNLENDKMKKK